MDFHASIYTWEMRAILHFVEGKHSWIVHYPDDRSVDKTDATSYTVNTYVVIHYEQFIESGRSQDLIHEFLLTT